MERECLGTSLWNSFYAFERKATPTEYMTGDIQTLNMYIVQR
jgi:hypothetical protein